MGKKIIFTVYFSGAGHSLKPVSTRYGYEYNLVNLLHQYTKIGEDHVNDTLHIKYGFDGCAVTHGWRGLIFGSGLKEQCRKIEKFVIAKLQGENTVILNCFGHSLGATTALSLVNELGKHVWPNLVMNVALLDPVPGNPLDIVALDFMHATLTKQTLHLQNKNLHRVLALYTNQPYPNYFHSPILPSYPAHCQIEEDVVPGKHYYQYLYSSDPYFKFSKLECFIPYERIKKFLSECETEFNINKILIIGKESLDKQIIIDDNDGIHALNKVYTLLLAKHKSAKKRFRSCHAFSSKEIQTNFSHAHYLNEQHKKIAHPHDFDGTTNDCALRITTIAHPPTVLGFLCHHLGKTAGVSTGLMIGATLGFFFLPFTLGLSIFLGAGCGAVLGLGIGFITDSLVQKKNCDSIPPLIKFENIASRLETKQFSQPHHQGKKIKTLFSDWRKRLNTESTSAIYADGKHTFFAANKARSGPTSHVIQTTLLNTIPKAFHF